MTEFKVGADVAPEDVRQLAEIMGACLVALLPKSEANPSQHLGLFVKHQGQGYIVYNGDFTEAQADVSFLKTDLNLEHAKVLTIDASRTISFHI